MNINSPSSEPALSLSADGLTYTVSFDRWDSYQFDRACWNYSVTDGSTVLVEGSDLTTVGDLVLTDALVALLDFLSAAVESYDGYGMEGESASLFPEGLLSGLDADSVSMLTVFLTGRGS